jgi:hypothetical protein
MRNKIALLALVITLVYVAKGMSYPISSATSYRSTVSIRHQVVYKVTTDRDWNECYDFDTTYEMPSGTAQKTVTLCDSTTSGVVDSRAGDSGDFVYLSVQNGRQLTRISCEIHIDGKLVHKTYSKGQYVIASCSGSIP